MSTTFPYQFEYEGDSTIIIRIQSPTQQHPDVEVNLAAIRIADEINALVREKKATGIIEAIPTFSTVGVYYRLDDLGTNAFEKVCQYLSPICDAHLSTETPINHTPNTVEIPVCYDTEFGIDLEELSQTLQISIDEIIRLHSQQAVRVFMLGFSPGLPYLGLFDEKFNIPRRATPRVKLAAGSIAIANRQCVIYPYETPGGWHIIGRTPLKLFDPNHAPYTRYKPGDMIVFKPISKEEYLSLK
ncbi:MAG: 5-oxoprolinase subunit PxpB [Pelistega sp.]|nr:5-oxoprolinase subunit PxpB [Pelistega sp.]